MESLVTVREVHKRFERGSETVEVSTFRGQSEDTTADEHGRLLSDNVFGSQPEDAAATGGARGHGYDAQGCVGPRSGERTALFRGRKLLGRPGRTGGGPEPRTTAHPTSSAAKYAIVSPA